MILHFVVILVSCVHLYRELKQLSDHLSSSEVSARELSKAHAAADAGRAAAEQSAAKANEAADTLRADLNQCRHILQARDMQVQTLASQFQEASHRLSVRSCSI